MMVNMKFSPSSVALWACLAAAVVAVPTENHGHDDHKDPFKHLPLVSSEALRKTLKPAALLAKAQTLEDFAYSTPERNRVIGTPGHNATVTWIHDTIAQFPDYYTLGIQPMTMPLGINASLTLNGVAVEVYAVGLSPSGHVTGKVVYVPNLGCKASDFPADTAGSIIVVKRGSCQSAVKSGLAGSAGAIGMIVYNNVPINNLDGYSLQRWTTAEGPFVPTGGINQADGQALVDKLASGVEVIAELNSVTANKTTYNVIAQTKCGDQDDVIHVGSHSDSVAQGPGINDNGSGTISLLEIAIQLTKFSVNNAVRFSWWAAEEEGLLGSEYYVKSLPQSEIDKIRLFLDFDMMASPNFAYQIYDGDGSVYNETGPPGSAEAEHDFIEYFTQIAKLNYTSIEFDGRSDYGPFLDAGIAAGGIAAGAESIKTPEEQAMFGGQAGVAYDINYHGPGDNVTNLNMECWTQMIDAIAHVTAKYAVTFDSLGPKNATLVAKRAAKAKSTMSHRSGKRI